MSSTVAGERAYWAIPVIGYGDGDGDGES